MSRTNVDKSITQHTKIPACKKIKRIKTTFTGLDAGKIYNVLQELSTRLQEFIALNIITHNDASIFSVSHVTLRDLLLQHQQLLLNEQSDEYHVILIKESFKEILRYLKVSGLTLKNFVNHNTERRTSDSTNTTSISLHSYLCTFIQLVREKLLTEPLAEHERRRCFLKAMEKSRLSHRIIKELEYKHQEAAAIRYEKVFKKDKSIRQHKNVIESIIASGKTENLRNIDTAGRTIGLEQNSILSRRRSIQQNITETSAKLSQLRVSHFEDESILRKKKAKLTAELDNWMHKYDEDMGWRQDEYDKLKARHIGILEEYEEVEKYSHSVNQKYQIILEERQQRFIEKKEREREAAARHYASIALQTWWRRVQARKERERLAWMATRTPSKKKQRRKT